MAMVKVQLDPDEKEISAPTVPVGQLSLPRLRSPFVMQETQCVTDVCQFWTFDSTGQPDLRRNLQSRKAPGTTPKNTCEPPFSRVPRRTLSAMMNSMSDPISIGEREVHVWFAPVPPDPGAEREAWAVLSPEEQARASPLKQHHDRAVQVFTRVLVRRVLATYLHVAPQEVAIAAGRKGKPEVVVDLDTPRSPRFNFALRLNGARSAEQEPRGGSRHRTGSRRVSLARHR